MGSAPTLSEAPRFAPACGTFSKRGDRSGLDSGATDRVYQAGLRNMARGEVPHHQAGLEQGTGTAAPDRAMGLAAGARSRRGRRSRSAGSCRTRPHQKIADQAMSMRPRGLGVIILSIGAARAQIGVATIIAVEQKYNEILANLLSIVFSGSSAAASVPWVRSRQNAVVETCTLWRRASPRRT
jgi:hypothetical protein